MSAPWLTIVGIGEDGLEGLSPAARNAIQNADHVFGGERHLSLARSLVSGESHPWPSPFDSSMEAVRRLEGTATCVLASGDPFHFGVGVTLARLIDPSHFHAIPHPSAFSLAASRLGWALQEIETVSLHGHTVSLLRRYLHDRARLLLLTSDGSSPAQIAQYVTGFGMGDSRLIILEALGGARERITEIKASALAERQQQYDPLNVVALDIRASADAPVIPLTPGLHDDFYLHDGQITKSDMRAITLAALAPSPGELLLDIGAGSGSIGIEWMLAHPRNRAVAIEENQERAARIAANAESLGVPGLKIVCGTAPEALEGLPQPDAVFVGGGATDDGVMDAALACLKPGGRLVANGVTLETEALLADLHMRHGGTLTRIQVGHAVPVGTMRGWRNAMPVTQWRYRKAGEA